MPTPEQGSSQSRWRRLLRLPAADRWQAVQAVFWLWAVAVAMRVAGVRRVHDWLARRSESRTGAPADGQAVAVRLARLVDTAARHGLPGHTCLKRSLVLWYLCRRRGVPVAVVLGARPTAAGLEAHAWVEHDGVVINDEGSVQRDYIPLSWTTIGRRA
ncbi:MAG TPA: lasso peptide biosynthesis B2 protein [Vicinamibacterales bacterium]|nr:lasso peptide biosynthesis B2 protein [Vicinamibacterales bacterium]